jgi:cytochrome P450
VGDFHRRQRRLVQPAFHANRIASYAGVMVDYTLDRMAGWRPGAVLDIDDVMMRLTMDIVSKTLFDAEVSSQANEVGEAINTLQALTVEDFKAGYMLPVWVPTRRNRQIRRATRSVDVTVNQFIRDRRESGEDKGDLLSMLLMAQDEDDGSVMTDRQVRDEAATLFAAGHETTSNALTWTWYLLSQNPHVERKLHDELDRVLGGRPPALADLKDLSYTEMVVKEALRLYPPAWVLMNRISFEPIQLNGFRIDPGDWIWVCPYITHRNPGYFADPERFDPERFAPQRESELPRYSYIPFGGGPRVCIGNSFAMMEARLVLATIAQKYRLEMVPGQQVVPEPEITLRTRNGLKVELVERT